MIYFIPVFFFIIFLIAIFKRVKTYDAFSTGAKEALPTIAGVFPFLVSIFVLTELVEVSGLSTFLTSLLSPIFNILGIPTELCKLVLIKPFSGSGALATLTEIYNTYGVDSYLARCASVIYGSSETVFYIAGIYFVNVKNKKLLVPIIISLIANFFSCVFACFICKLI